MILWREDKQRSDSAAYPPRKGARAGMATHPSKRYLPLCRAGASEVD
jgi:hypothetical protein